MNNLKGSSLMQPLLVKAEIQTKPTRFSMPAWVEVKLTNQQADPVLINKRLGIGYRNSLDRELFAEVFRHGENEAVSTEAVDYARDPATASDYVWLQPGETVSASFDLFDWYTLPGPGEYDLVVSYQADDSPDGHPGGLLTGIHSSNRIPLDVIA